MTGRQGIHMRERMRERFAAYTELRDAGTRPVDAARETGITDCTGEGYERAYRDLRGLPRRAGRGWGP